MKQPRWNPISQERPCPVCRSIRGGCKMTDTAKAVWCTLPDLVADPESAGLSWYVITKPREGAKGVLYSALNDAGDPWITRLAPPSDRTEEADKWTERNTRLAVTLAGQAKPSPRVEEYLRARGIPIEKLPGGVVPASLQFLPNCPAGNGGREAPSGPAMVARILEIHDVDGRPTPVQSGLHRTFLDPAGAPRKRDTDEFWASNKQMLGQCNGRGIWLGKPSGILFIAEGIETTLSGMAAIGCAGLVSLSSEGMQVLSVPLSAVKPLPGAGEQPAGPGKIHTIIIGADANRGGMRKDQEAHATEMAETFSELNLPREVWLSIARKPTGLRAACLLRERLQAAYPWVTVFVKAPTAEIVPDLMVVAEKGTYQGLSVPKKGEDGKAGGVDWNDVLNAVGLEATRSALMKGVDVDTGAKIAAGYQGPMEQMRSVWDATDEVPVASTDGGMGGNGGRGNSVGLFPGGSGGDDPGNAGGGGRHFAVIRGGARDGERRLVLPSEDLHLARMFLEDVCAPPRGRDRAGRGLYLMSRPGDKEGHVVSRFREGRWERSSLGVVMKHVREYLTRGCKANETMKGIDYVPFDPSEAKVRAVARAALDECMVVTQRTRFWMRPLFDDAGRPRWGRSESEIAVEAAELGKPEPEQVLTFTNCQLSQMDLVKGVCAPWANSELLYNETVFPYQLPIDEFRKCLEGGSFDEMVEKHAPIFHAWFRGLEFDDDERALAQRSLGYFQTSSTAIKPNNILLLVGPKDSGKGTMGTVYELGVGEDNVATSTFRAMGQPFHMASWRHKLMVYIDEAEQMGYDASAEAVEIMKILSGGGKWNIRDLYEKANPNERLMVRFLVSCNELPEMQDRSGAWLSRLRFLNFRKSHSAKLDPKIKEGIKREGLGIVVWGIEGMLQGFGEVLPQPESSDTVVSLMKGVTNPLDEFLDEWFDIVKGPAGADESVFLSNELIHLAYCVRFKKGNPDPRRRGRVIKSLLSPLQDRGWRGKHAQPRQEVDKPDGTGVIRARPGGYTGLKLTAAALEAIAEYERGRDGVKVYGPSQPFLSHDDPAPDPTR
jgi:hypothetical protein